MQTLITDLHVAAAALDRAALGGGFEFDVASSGDRVATDDAAYNLARASAPAARHARRPRAVIRTRTFHRAFIAIVFATVAVVAIIAAIARGFAVALGIAITVALALAIALMLNLTLGSRCLAGAFLAFIIAVDERAFRANDPGAVVTAGPEAMVAHNGANA
ncbi:MAG TPA: hypothetical protein VGL45_14310, partial [Bradyrhizobium sp.]